MKDDYVMGACLFVTGAAGLPEWETFEHLGPIMARIEVFQEEITLDASVSTSPPPSTPIEIRTKPATVPSSLPATDFETPPAEIEVSMTAEVAPTVPTVESEADTTIAVDTTPSPAKRKWQLEIERGAGLSLLVGDIGLANEQITITRPDGVTVQVVSGSKPEFGVGGFEVYAEKSGTYKVEFLDQSFEISMSGQFTRATFSKAG